MVDDWLGIRQSMLISAVSQTLSSAGTTSTLNVVPPASFEQRAEPQPTSDGFADWFGDPVAGEEDL